MIFCNKIGNSFRILIGPIIWYQSDRGRNGIRWFDFPVMACTEPPPIYFDLNLIFAS